jgi:hypothetical protein
MRPLWSHRTPSAVRGLSLAREPGTLLVWDADHVLTWLSRAGEVHARWEAPDPVADADVADDGSAAVALGTAGTVWLLAPDLKPRWRRGVAAKGLAVAVAPFAGVLAVSDGGGTIHFLDGLGRGLTAATSSRPLHHLVLVPERPLLVGSADFGSVAAFSLSGTRRWQDTPVAHCGALATTGDGMLIALACFSEGLLLYDFRGQKRRDGPHTGPCRLVALSYDGTALATAGLDGVVRLHDRAGTVRSEFRPDANVSALALDALGRTAFVGLADGTVVALTAD